MNLNDMSDILNYLANRVGIVSFLTGIILIIYGLIMMKFPPKEINLFFGYRTERARKNQEVWDFAQKYRRILLTKLHKYRYL